MIELLSNKWLEGNNMKKIRIMSLGEIVTPSFDKGVTVLAEIVSKKKQSEIKKLKQEIQSVIQENTDAVLEFKKGSSEENFDKLLIEALQKKLGVEITSEEFNKGWAAMNPTYSDYQSVLEAAIAFHKKENQELILISYTNIKDLRQLSNELEKHNIAHERDNKGNLCAIAGIKLHATYVHQCDKADLIKKIIIELKQSTSPRNTFFSESKEDSPKVDIKYIHGVNQLQFETLRKDLDNTNSAVKSTAEKFQVDSILWNKNPKALAQSLTEILNEEKPVHRMMLTSAL